MLQSLRKDHFNEHYFDKIDNEAKAYWLGFLFAEGNISAYTLSIQLGAIDKPHLQLFKLEIASRYKLDYRKDKDAYRVRLNSVVLRDSLKKLGITPRKSWFIRVPKLRRGLMRHFFRGFVDGDGWISHRIQKKCGTVVWYMGAATCSRVFLQSFKEWANTELGNNYGSLIERKKKNCFQLSFCGRKSVMGVADLLYHNSHTAMSRKKKLYEAMRREIA